MKDIEFLKKHYLWIVIILFILGIALDVLSNNLVPHYNNYYYYDNNGQHIKEFLSYEHKYLIIKLVSNSAYSFSITLFISLFIIKRFEDKNNELFKENIIEIQRGINKDVFEGVFNRMIDPVLFEIVKREVLNKNVIRKNADWIYDISEQKDGYLLMQTLSYELHNATDLPQTEKVELTIMPDEDVTTVIRSYRIHHHGNVLKAYDKQEEIVKKEKTVPFCFEIPPNDCVDITLVIENIYKKFSIIDMHTSKYPIVGLKIQVNHPKDCDFEICPTFSSSFKKKSHEDTKIIYEPVSGILAGQGIAYKINKINT